MKKYLSLLLLLIGTTVTGQTIGGRTFDVDLWPKGMPNTNGMDKEPFDESKGNFKPSIRVFLPPENKATGRAVVACPGGGYANLAYHHEGYDWAPYFNAQGIALVVLKYRMPNGGHTEVPVSDAEEALKIVHDSADVWNINRRDIGIMGSSAGGHLASTIATQSDPKVRPDFQILFYPVITMDKSYTHIGSHNSLLGKNAPKELEEKYSNEKQVTPETPRAFIVFSDDDKGVSPINGANYYAALNRNRVPAVFYVFPSGGHGWGFHDYFTHKSQMINLLTTWLNTWSAPKD